MIERVALVQPVVANVARWHSTRGERIAARRDLRAVVRMRMDSPARERPSGCQLRGAITPEKSALE